MTRFVPILILSVAVGIVGAADAARPAASSRAVLAPIKRLEALKLADKVLAPRAPSWKTTVADLPDPFFRKNFTQEEKIAEVDPMAGRSELSDLDVLAAAATQIRPDGIIQDILLLGGKRHKAGAQLPVTLDGVVYTITISAIEGKSYTLQLNEQELRQQLK
jgi:hypothetical protein